MRKRAFPALLVVVLLLTGCVSFEQRYGDLRGYVGIRRDLSVASLDNLVGEINPENIVLSTTAFDADVYFPLEGARISISGTSERFRTNEQGMFYAYQIPTGYRKVTISHEALRQDLVREVRVVEGRNTIDFIGGVGYYIVIGIDHYPSIEIKDATGAENDAISVADVFRRFTKLPGYGVTLLGDRARREDIKREIRYASGLATPDDYLVIYFAGHMGSDFLSPYDDEGRYYSTAITDSDLEGWLRDFPGYVTVILDGSESATFADGREPLIRPMALRKPKYTVITSAKENQDAIVVGSKHGEHGLFTHYLIAGLSTPEELAKSDRNRDGTITAWEIIDYIESGMSYYQREKYGKITQEPKLHVGSLDNTVILRY